MSNLILDTDSYKASHFLQYPPGTDYMFSYIESRGGQYEKTVFFGLQYLLKEYLSKPITQDNVDEAASFFKLHGLPFPREQWEYIVNTYSGYLPIKIKAVAEGSIIPTGNILVSVESLDPKVFWVVGWLETLLLRIWYPVTVATRSYHVRELINKYLIETADNPEEEIWFKLHDFGSRGVSSAESAGIGGMSHLVNFKGSDTVKGVYFANKYYNHDMSAVSIPSAEHSGIISWGRDNEVDAYKNMLTKFAKKDSFVAIVSDSYDIYNAISNLWGVELRQQIIDSGALVVLRPDSGVPHEVVLRCLDLLSSRFGYTMNSKGYKVFNNVRIMQGDGINEQSIQKIIDTITRYKYSITNVAFGMGGALLQQVDRDTQKFAMKCSCVCVEGKYRDVYKDPITDLGKTSKKGQLGLFMGGSNPLMNEGKSYVTRKIESAQDEKENLLKTVFSAGEIIQEYTLEEIRHRLHS